MPYKCVVSGCNSGYKTCKTKRHMFKVPKHPELRAKWEKAISRDDFIFRDSTRVCDLHFERRFIQKSLTSLRQSLCDETVKVPRTKPRLAPDAVPTLFLNCNNARRYNRTRKLSTSALEQPLNDDTPTKNSTDSQKRERRERSPSVELLEILPDPKEPSLNSTSDVRTSKTLSQLPKRKLTSFRLQDLKEMYKIH